MHTVFAKSGVDLDDFSKGLTRLAVETKQRMPEIERQIDDSNNQIIESNIKRRESHRSLEKAVLDQSNATDALIKANAQYQIQLETGGERRAVELRGAQLGVSGAQLGVQGAQRQQTAAAIQQAYAPQEQALQDIQGPLTVENARFGWQTAQLGIEEAMQARDQAYRTRGPSMARWLAQRRAELGVQGAQLRARNADVSVQRSYLTENERVTQERAGLGPVGQANFQAAQAGQATQQADLTLRERQLQEKRVEQLQTAITRAAEDEEAKRVRDTARLTLESSGDAVIAKRIERDRTDIEARQTTPYTNLGNVVTMLRGGTLPPGQMPPGGWDWNQVVANPAVMRDALLAEGKKYTVGEHRLDTSVRADCVAGHIGFEL
jgi:hypothetical protein